MPNLPTGTVTFLFTDIESSTPLVQQLGARYAQVQRDHQALLRAVWAAHAGAEVDTQGDSFFVAFARATDALAAAADAQRQLADHPWPAGARVRVRMGLHTGTAELATPGQYVGIDVIRGARIAAAGHGGQVLLSQATRDQVAQELVAGAGLRDLGRHRLKGLARREEIYQLVLPGLPAEYPPLKTLDAWPGLRADLAVVAALSLALLAVVGLVVPLMEPAFPRWIGLGAATLAVLLLAASAVVRPVRRTLLTQWRDARKPFATVTSGLLSAVVIVTTLFITKPAIFLGPKHLGYDFSYTYHAPTHTGGAIKVGTFSDMSALAPDGFGDPFFAFPLWQGCVIQLPDLALGLDGWKPDQCTDVPTVANGDEDPLGQWTTFHIDPRAAWSDGMPVVADDFLFAARLMRDPAISVFGSPAWRLTAIDSHTVRIQWATPTADYLAQLGTLMPLPLHVYTAGKFTGVYDPKTGAYDSTLAQQLVANSAFSATIPVDNGPFTVRSFVPFSQAVLVRNPRFFSNFLHRPALDQITFVSAFHDFAAQMAQNQPVPTNQLANALLADYRGGAFEFVDNLGPPDLRDLSGMPKARIVTVPNSTMLLLGFNERVESPNARANGGASIFADRSVRQAFTEAFDRCAASRAQLGISNCADPNLFTDEPVNAAYPDYDPMFHLPGYHPADAAALLDRAGYKVVDGLRRYKDGVTPIRLRLVVSNAGATASVLIAHMLRDWAKNLKVDVFMIVDPGLTAPGPQGTFPLGTFDMAIVVNSAGAPDPVGYLTGNFGPFDLRDIPDSQHPNRGNLFGIIDQYVGQQDRIGAQTLDYGQRIAVYRSLDRYFAQQFYIDVLNVAADVALVKPTLCNFKQWPSPSNDAWNSADWYVASSCPT